ncbi:MAG: FHA domain-containing protein [Chloroflexi bacterium]|nr:FHA domain-containing protein [Chloroflexota bacterium]
MTVGELLLLALRFGAVVGIYLFCAWVTLVVARSLSRHPAPRPSPSPAILEVLEAIGETPVLGQRFALGEYTVVGRDPTCAIVLADAYVSSRHAVVERRDGGFWVRDLGSTNGTLVNDRPLRGQVALRPDDRLQVGRVVFRFTR